MKDNIILKLHDKLKSAVSTFTPAVSSIPLTLSAKMFYPEMVSSNHGIAHTTRVLLAAHLLCDALNLPDAETKACYIAAIVHDLGKKNDTEGEKHGFQSMLLYKEKINSIIEDDMLGKRILNAIRYHSIADEKCPEDVRRDIIWKVLKDADALDRSRFGELGCDITYLRLPLYEISIGKERHALFYVNN